MTNDRIHRERDFWDHAVPLPEEAIRQYELGPDANTRLMLEAINPRPGLRVLDFACGAGVTSAWLASVGAEVTGIDLSEANVRVAEEVARHSGRQVRLICGDVEQLSPPGDGFDAIVGRYALHHLDIKAMAPILAGCLRPGGVGAFLETFAINPVLAFARNHLIGRYGIPRFGTLDEHPLTSDDVETMRRSFSRVELTVDEFRFLWMINRQLLRGRYPSVTRLLRRADQRLKRFRPIEHWSFHQVLLVSTGEGPPLVDEMVRCAPSLFGPSKS